MGSPGLTQPLAQSHQAPSLEAPDNGALSANRQPASGSCALNLEQFRSAARSLAYARIGDFDAADDLTQEAFERVLRRQNLLRDPSKLPAYLRRTIENLCINHLRNRKDELPLALLAERELALSVQDVATDNGGGTAEAVHLRLPLWAPSAEEVFIKLERYRRVLDAIHRLPPLYRDTLILRSLDGLRYAEIAEFLGLNPETVKKRLQTARRLLARGLEQEEAMREELPLTCQQVSDLLDPFIDGELDFPAVRRIHRHLHQCPRCTERLERHVERVRQVDLALRDAESHLRLGCMTTPRFWQKAWQLMEQRVDEIASDLGQTGEAIQAFALAGLARGQADVLLRLAEACVQRNPRSPVAYYCLGIVEIRRHEYEAAEAAFQRELELALELPDEGDRAAQRMSAYEGLAWVCRRRALVAIEAGDVEAARAAQERGLPFAILCRDLDTDGRPHAQVTALCHLAALGREEEALQELQRYLDTMAARGQRPVYWKVACALRDLGRREEALEWFERGTAANPLDVSTGMAYLADRYEALGQPGEAAFWRARVEVTRKTSGWGPDGGEVHPQ